MTASLVKYGSTGFVGYFIFERNMKDPTTIRASPPTTNTTENDKAGLVVVA